MLPPVTGLFEVTVESVFPRVVSDEDADEQPAIEMSTKAVTIDLRTT
jgi:hypothetical protein